MEFDELTEEEKGMTEAFIASWSERDRTPIYVGENKGGITIGKIKGIWTSYSWVRGERYDMHVYPTFFELADRIYSFLDKRNEEHCKDRFLDLLIARQDGVELEKEEYVEYENLGEDEKKVLDAFIKVLKESGDLPRNIVYPSKEEVDEHIERLQFYKKGNKWVSYILERNERGGYREYDSLVPLCFDSFECLEKSHTDYCKSVFPGMIQDILKKTEEPQKH